MTTEWNRPAGGLSLAARLLLGALIPAAALVLLFLNLWPPGATPTRPAPPPPAPAVTRQMEMEGAEAHGLTPPTVAQDFAGIDRPPALPAAQAGLADDEEVIGVVVGGRSRAYLVRAFCRGPASHIVNDMLGGAAVSVTYCDQRDCARVFAGEGAEPLDLRQGGLEAGQMTLRAAGVRYGQESLSPEDAKGAPPFPYVAHAVERTTWGAWRGAHPGTDVYLGPPPAS